MLRKLAWLTVAMLLVPSFAVSAATLQAGIGTPPKSMDRNLAPDKFPTNTVKILRTTNKAQTNSYVPVVFQLRQVNPFSVIRFLHRPIETEEGLIFTFVNPDGRSGLVLYAVPLYMVDSLRDLVAAVDRPGLTSSANDLRIYRQLQHRRADASDPDFLKTAASFLTGDGSTFIPDPSTNALYYADAPSGANNLDQALTDELDKPTAMIQLVVKVYEINSSNDATLGLDYQSWINGPGANLFTVGAFAERGHFGNSHDASGDPLGTGAHGLPGNSFSANGWNYAYDYNVPSAFFDFLTVKGKAKLLTEEKLAVLNTHHASLRTGDEILYYKVAANTTANGSRPTGQPFADNALRSVTEQVASRDASMHLDVTPLIGEQQVQLHLHLRWSDFNGIADDGTPQINDRNLDTDVRAKIGDEIMIGGLDRQIKLQSKSGVPVLSSIPVLGYIFGGETAQTQKTEMVVSIQPVGVMSYDVAKDYKVDAASASIMDKANGKEEITEPALPWGFDMFATDKEYGIREPIGDKQ